MDEEDHRDSVKDLASSMAGIYRILDLISERGSGGLGECLLFSELSLCIADIYISGQDSHCSRVSCTIHCGCFAWSLRLDDSD
jgi:hypothetical protein